MRFLVTGPIYISSRIFVAFGRLEKFIRSTAALASDFRQRRAIRQLCAEQCATRTIMCRFVSYRFLHISCQTRGARRTIKSFYDCRDARRIFLPQIRSASPDLIAVAGEFSPRSFSVSSSHA